MLAQQIRGSASLLESVDAVRNWRAVLLLFATFAAAALAFVLAGFLARVSFVFLPLFGLAAWAVAFYGGNAVGMMMLDEAGGQPSRSIGAAVSASLATSHRLILLLLLLFALYVGGVIAFSIVLFICKIPFLGPLLYTVVFPLGVIVSGIAFFAVPTVIFPLAAPAVWRGAGVLACVGQLVAIARKRLVFVLLMMIAVTLISAAVSMLIGMVLLSGTAITTSLSAGILGSGGMGMNGMGMGMGPMGLLMGGAMGGHAVAGMIGGGLLFAVAFTLPGMVYLRGASTVYLRAIDGLDLDAAQAEMGAKLAGAKARAREMQAQAQDYAQRARASAAPGAGAATATASAAAASDDTLPPPQAALSPDAAAPCPACGTATVAGDAFCGNCGHRLA